MAEFWTRRWYRDVWLFTITLLVLFAIKTNNNEVDAIQQERVRECLDQNHRNQTTKARLRAAAAADIAKAERTARERGQIPELFRKEIEGRRDVTLALIDTLAPYTADCYALDP